jgi:uncharacterized protein (TIGR03435 family)
MRLRVRLLRNVAGLLLSVLLFSHLPAATAQTPQAAFEVATVKSAVETDPNTGSWSHPGIGKFIASHLSLSVLIALAYDVDASQIANKPDWLDSSLYDVMAKPEDGIKLSREELRPRLQNLLQQRFHLVVHTEMRPVRGYALVAAKSGPHLMPTEHSDYRGDFSDVTPGQMRGFHWTMQQLAKYLTRAAGFPVVDQTGIAGQYDIGFGYNPKPDAESTLPPLDVALERATGLLLKPGKVPAETIVIDSVEKVPTAN